MKKIIVIILLIIGLGVISILLIKNSNDTKEKNTISTVTPPIQLKERAVIFEDGTEVVFNLASDFNMSIAAENLGKARFMTMSPDGRLFIPDMVNFNDNRLGKIYILDDFNEKTFRFEKRLTYLSELRNPHSLAFYTDSEGKSWIYVALTDRLIRYPYQMGDETPSGNPEVILEFPAYRTVSSGPWHITRTILFKDDKLYVSVGSSCNVCEEPIDEIRSEIITLTPTGEDVKTYANGLRNAVGMVWAGDDLFVTVNGVDHLGANNPDDVMYKIIEGTNYGFPYCYEVKGKILTENDWPFFRTPLSCENVPLSFSAFGPHTAPLGITYFENAHPILNNSFLVALHGSFNVNIGNGYQVVRTTKDGNQDIFLDGFIKTNKERVGRPVHVLQYDKNSFFFTDDFSGRLYYVYSEKI
jgi:glucose/arabinose dehydrogenase